MHRYVRAERPGIEHPKKAATHKNDHLMRKRMDTTRLTSIVLLALLHLLIIGIVAWDVTMIWLGHGQETVSEILREWSRRYPELLLVLGMLLYHLFGSR
jgi:hypothetical protein